MTIHGNTYEVSFDDEPLILVDSDDHEIGFCTKVDAHNGAGKLHRAFSLFIFNSAGELLIQQRSPNKRLWPGYWSNTCCSHPRRGESMESAIQRRLWEEVGIQASLIYLYKFQYQAKFGEHGAENELCWVYVGYSDEPTNINANEISATRYLSPEGLDSEINENPNAFTPWFKIEWQRIRYEYPDIVPDSYA